MLLKVLKALKREWHQMSTDDTEPKNISEENQDSNPK